MALNDPRTIDYDFQVFELDCVVWLFDDSERAYCCSATPMIWAEPMYSLGGEDHYCEGSYFGEESVTQAIRVCKYHRVCDKEEAWEEAREEACTNRLI